MDEWKGCIGGFLLLCGILASGTVGVLVEDAIKRRRWKQ